MPANNETAFHAYLFRGGPEGGSAVCYGAPECRCGSRRTERIGDSALLRFCHDCLTTYRYVLHDGYLVPMALETYAAMMETK